jgi:hypothetical protein
VGDFKSSAEVVEGVKTVKKTRKIVEVIRYINFEFVSNGGFKSIL